MFAISPFGSKILDDDFATDLSSQVIWIRQAIDSSKVISIDTLNKFRQSFMSDMSIVANELNILHGTSIYGISQNNFTGNINLTTDVLQTYQEVENDIEEFVEGEITFKLDNLKIIDAEIVYLNIFSPSITSEIEIDLFDE